MGSQKSALTPLNQISESASQKNLVRWHRELFGRGEVKGNKLRNKCSGTFCRRRCPVSRDI